MSLSDFNSAARLREIIRSVCEEVVLDIYPQPRMATVTAVDPSLRTATVVYPDDPVAFTVPFGSSHPYKGAVVRIAGKRGSKFIEDVVSSSSLPAGAIISGGWATAPAGFALLNGQVITNGATDYPDVAAQYPSWVTSTVNLTLPDMSGYVLLGTTSTAGTRPVTSNAKTVSITSSHIPTHRHAMGDHTHYHNHYHDATHSHDPAGYNNGGGWPYRNPGGGVGWDIITGPPNVVDWYTNGATAATRSMSTGWASSGDYTSYMNATHGGTIYTDYQYTGGTALPYNTTPAHMLVKFAVRLG